MDILIIAAHPDDEVLGMGATIKKLTKKKNKVRLCVVSEGATAQYQDKKMIDVRKEACIKAGNLLGVSNFHFLEFPDMRLDSVPHLEVNKSIEKIIKEYMPEIVYTTPHNDLNKDHQRVYESTLVVTRPTSSSVKQILCYEIPGFSRTPFHPNVYEDITKEILLKKKSMMIYKSEMERFPHPRSVETIESLAIYRGMESGFLRAESFELIRSLNK